VASINIEINWQKTKLLAVPISYSDAFSKAWRDHSGGRRKMAQKRGNFMFRADVMLRERNGITPPAAPA
jgi:hypothetical protein